MLFNAPKFLLVLLPAVPVRFFVLGALQPQRAVLRLIAASLSFYAWWRVEFLPLLINSVALNYAVGRALSRRPGRCLPTFGIAGDLGWLGAPASQCLNAVHSG